MQKTALVTGASSGLGYEFAKLLANDKYDLVLVARREDKLNEIKDELETCYHVKVILIFADLTNPHKPQEIFDQLTRQGISIEILINNAGFGSFGKFQDVDWSRQTQMLQLNIVSLSHLTKLFLPGMIKRGEGKILNMASTAAFHPGPLMSVYYASKAYVLHFSEAVANELKGTGVSLTVLCPGPTATGFQATANLENSRLMKMIKLPTAAQVAECGYSALKKGKVLVIHGTMNKILTFSTRFIPRRWTTEIIRKFQEIDKINDDTACIASRL